MSNKSKPDKKFTLENNLKLLFIGETGSGKSTLINMAVNLIHGIDYRSERKFAIPQKLKFQFTCEELEPCMGEMQAECNIEEFMKLSSENGKSESGSQTRRPNIYRLRDKTTKKMIEIIDTPGLNDTRGQQYDDLHIKSIIHAIFYIGGVDLICIVHNATDARLKPGTELAMKRLTSMFTSKCLGNFVVCLTNSSSNIAPNCKDSLVQLGIPQNNVLQFENTCLVPPEAYEQLSIKKFGEEIDAVDDATVECGIWWKNNTKSFNKLIKIGYGMQSLDIEGVKDLFLEMEAIEKFIQFLTDSIRRLESSLHDLSIEKEQIVRLREKMKSNKDFENTYISIDKVVNKVMDTRKEKRPLSYTAAKSKQRDATWGFWSYAGYIVGGVVTLGAVFVIDAADTLIGTAAGKEIDGYYEWVDIPYEKEVIEWKETKKNVIDSEKEKLFNEAQDSLRVAELRLSELESTLLKQEQEIESSYQIVSFLLDKMKESGIGGPISIDTLVNQIDSEIKNIKYDKHPNHFRNSELIRELESRKERLVLVGEIIERAKNHRVESLSLKQYDLLSKFKSTEHINRGNILALNRKIYESAAPCEFGG